MGYGGSDVERFAIFPDVSHTTTVNEWHVCARDYEEQDYPIVAYYLKHRELQPQRLPLMFQYGFYGQRTRARTFRDVETQVSDPMLVAQIAELKGLLNDWKKQLDAKEEQRSDECDNKLLERIGELLAAVNISEQSSSDKSAA